MTRPLGALLLLVAPLPAQSGSLTPVERRIVAAADRLNPEGLDLLERVVNINSGTMNFAGVRAVGRVFEAELTALGFATHWEDGTPFRRAGHLVAERTGTGPRLLLIGHLDTVFEPEHPFQRFERLSGDRARGPGVLDMKGGDVIIVQALKALKAAGQLDRMSITVVLHGDEEHAGEPLSLARRALLEAARRSDIAIGFEDGDGNPDHAVAARRGASGWELTSTGIAAHSSQVFREGVGAGAIYESARVLQGFRERLSGDPLLTFNPGLALGGTSVTLDSARVEGAAAGKSNVVPARMVVVGDLRTITPEKLEWARATMREVVRQHLPGTTSSITFDDGYPPMAPTEGNLRLLASYDQVSRDLGAGPVTMVNPANAGAADISFVAGIVPMGIDAIGMKGWDGHNDKETADLSKLPLQVRRAALFLHRLATQGAPRS